LTIAAAQEYNSNNVCWQNAENKGAFPMNTFSSAKKFYFTFNLGFYFGSGYFCCGKMNREPNS